MPKIPLRITMSDFTGGLNDNVKANVLEDNQLSKAHNVFVSQKGITTRGGFKKTTDIVVGLQKAYTFYKSDNTKATLFFGTAMYENLVQKQIINTIDYTNSTCMTYKNTSGGDIALIRDNSMLKVYNGVDVRNVVPKVPSTQEITDYGVNDLPNLTSVRAMTIKDSRIFIAGHPIKKNMVHYSVIDKTSSFADYTYFPAVYSFIVSSIDNDEIIDLKVFRDNLIVFCKRNIYAVTGILGSVLTSANQIVKLNVESGAIAKDSIVEVENSIFYLSDLGVYELYNSDFNLVAARKISDNIENTLKTVTKSTARGVFFDNKYILNFNEIAIVYDIRYRSWVTWSLGTITHIRKDNGVLYIIKNGVEMAYDITVFDDNGVPFTPYVLSKSYDYGYITDQKKVKHFFYVFEQYLQSQSTFTVELWADSAKVSEVDISTKISGVFDEAVFDGATFDFQQIIEIEKRAKLKGKYIQIAVTTKNQSAFHIFSINLKGSVKTNVTN